MRTLLKPSLNNLGYIWGQKNSSRTSCLQFADDGAIISSSIKNSQALLNIYSAWCNWAKMTIRVDKCCSFGMMKRDNQYQQIEPSLGIGNNNIPTVPMGGLFKYLGKIFDFEMANKVAKMEFITKLKNLMDITYHVVVKVQWKLKIVKQYVHAQLLFDLKLYDFGSTWIDQNLDSVYVQYIRDWLGMPPSACMKDMMMLRKSKGGLSLPLLKNLSENVWLQKRYTMKTSRHQDVTQIWTATANKHITIDSLLTESATFRAADAALKKRQVDKATKHFYDLPSQGIAAQTVASFIPKANILHWSKQLESVPESLHNFAKKALQQLLPTAANLARWGRAVDSSCQLCKKGRPQTNKHVLSNCDSPIALERYTGRHNKVLLALAHWISRVKTGNQSLCVDVIDDKFLPIGDLFGKSCRPDLALLDDCSIIILELTVCHETNLAKSKLFKTAKYSSISDHLLIQHKGNAVKLHTVEVSTLGFVSNLSEFTTIANLPKVPIDLFHSIASIALNCSYAIYCNRNSNSA